MIRENLYIWPVDDTGYAGIHQYLKKTSIVDPTYYKNFESLAQSQMNINLKHNRPI